jgi:ABC-type dipeptide/oligopeptide/nickel transport system permease subunit
LCETTTARTTRRHLLAAAALTLTAGLSTTADTEADAPMKHIVLLGDSVFDNAAYVAGGPDVIQQVRERLPAGWRATLRAVDGSVIGSVERQLHLLPPKPSHGRGRHCGAPPAARLRRVRPAPSDHRGRQRHPRLHGRGCRPRPWIAGDPIGFNPIDRLRPPSAEFWFGTDNLGRDVYARTVYSARISLLVGLLVAIASIALGLVIGLVAGFYRGLDGVVMRIMDGIMAIPAILLAIALVALTRASVEIVIVAIAIPEIPRVVRLVRSVVLTASSPTSTLRSRVARAPCAFCSATSCRTRWRR